MECSGTGRVTVVTDEDEEEPVWTGRDVCGLLRSLPAGTDPMLHRTVLYVHVSVRSLLLY